ncbi:hypothetical protein ACN083_03925 [Rothia sp. CCM 9418]|uniref:hypothetical protein n=1 Tax=Rothia sp. CCM 9418 TaxID=3402661 RepID=UPI003ADF6999
MATLTPNNSRAYRRLVDTNEYYKFALNRRISRNITATMCEIGTVLQVAVADLDTDHYLLNTLNGTPTSPPLAMAFSLGYCLIPE